MKNTWADRYLKIGLSLFFIDRMIKYIIVNYISSLKISRFLSIDLIFNRGISFGLFDSENYYIQSCLIIVISIVLGWLILHTVGRFLQHKTIIGEVLIFAGALSNLLDRFMYPGVVDFIMISYKSWYFPVFNGADVLIFVGVVGMLGLEYYEKLHEFCKK
jgi:signal peptidase II